MIVRRRAVLLGAFFLCRLYAVVNCTPPSCDESVEKSAKAFLKEFDTTIKKWQPIIQQASWNYAANMTDYNQKLEVDTQKQVDQEIGKVANKGSSFNMDHLCSNKTSLEIFNVLMYRRPENASEMSEDNTPQNRLSQIATDMERMFTSAKPCLQIDGHTSCMEIEPGLTQLFRASRNETVLSKAWTRWRDDTGKKMRELFKEDVDLNHKMMKGQFFDNRAIVWRLSYGTNDTAFENDVMSLLDQVKPLYQQIHAFVRRKLRKVYKDSQFPDSGLIPAHLLGNMWAETWENVYHDVMPFPNQKPIDITEEMKKQNYTVIRMFETAEEFFTSMGLFKMTAEFWKNSMFVKPKDRDVVCHASAWDFGDGQDFRIKMCTTINQEDFISIHHEMGHIQYDMQYRNQSFFYHDGPNPGFHEAVGDTLALSVGTPKHLRQIGLLDKNTVDNDETDMNYLMSVALQRLAFLPFGYLVDRWRWDVFEGKTTSENYNDHWWYLRCKLQGLAPPVQRSEEDFDPGAKYHVAAGAPYIRYFVSHILQFQFYEALCNETDLDGPLHKCDFYKNTRAGEKLSKMLRLGSSVSWPEALEAITGSRKLDIGPLKRYFEPLIKYLEKANADDPEGVGWDENCEHPSSPFGIPTTTDATTTVTTPGSANSCNPRFMVIIILVTLVLGL